MTPTWEEIDLAIGCLVDAAWDAGRESERSTDDESYRSMTERRSQLERLIRRALNGSVTPAGFAANEESRPQ